MELQLSRVDYTVIGVTTKNCLKLLPSNNLKEQQKVAVADSEGILQVFSIKKDDIQLHFKTLPGPAIASLQTAGTAGTAHDKIFIACGNEVKGYTKKGKLFLVFDSGMTETINTMFVLGNELFLCGKHVYSHFRDCKDVGSYLCGDTIVDVIAFYMTKTKRLTSLIACEGRMIRVLEHARVTCSMEVENSPTILQIFEDDDSKTVLFGTIDGKVGILDVENLQGFQRWLISNEKNSSAISCMDTYDMTGNGTKNLILGRQDGNIEVYYVNVHDAMDATYIIFVESGNESITSLKCGIVSAAGYDEILVVTYSGRIFGLTTQVTDVNFDGSTGSYVFSSDTSTKINKLKSEIEELMSKLSKEREKYQTSTESTGLMELSAIPPISINSSLALDRKSATYFLTLEAPTAIDNILIQCNSKVELLDVEKNTAVVSYSQPYNATKGNAQLLATYRCQVNTNRIELKIQTSEGEKAVLQAYVSPVLQPKCSRLLQFDIKALSLHYRIHEYDDNNRPYSSLKLRGTFSLAEIHNWVGQCLPEVPEKHLFSDETILYFQCSLIDTVLICTYKKGEADFQSDNLTTLCILKEVLTVEATKKKTKIDIAININDQCLDHVIKKIEPKLLEHKKLIKDKNLFDALNELEISEEENVKYLSPKYKNLLERKNTLVGHFNSFPDYLSRLYDAILNLYKDYNKLKGIQVTRTKVMEIEECLQNYSYASLISLFKPC
ncbi:Bardet-Biedl syndrome 7 protein homolog [Sitophilus oryzae]|uniref:Bardet-Biedl syndrome 7 protein homolog n=1 Tax=Sitophilus oryzae TaxID=7048 RepID=A0A6J2X7Q4_SITOR|nr:Bardet-Biedl syndrome 7 protein homolog [Sitophilus oryzae]